ncbi:15463_t:CDS:1, partial [Dentiscutata erythropus]
MDLTIIKSSSESSKTMFLDESVDLTISKDISFDESVDLTI